VRKLLPLLAVALLLAGCTAAAPTPTPTSSTPKFPVDKQLIAVMPSPLDADTAATETVRLADAMQAILPKDVVLGTDNHAQLVAKATGVGHYYAVLRAITLTATSDPIGYAKGLVAALEASGWVERTTSDTTANYLTALQSDRSDLPWIVLVGGDASVSGQSVVSLQLASPDLP
jgi:ABC-type dipeptide/oligopeptide/nickel transport system permease subunit